MDRENGCGKDKLGNVVLGDVGTVCANFWDPFASILFYKVTHNRPPRVAQAVWGEGHVQLANSQFKASLILARNGKKPGQVGTGGRSV